MVLSCQIFNRFLKCLAIVTCAICTCAPRSVAQAGASISGTVRDPSGLVVVGATVTVNDVGTGLTRDATTDAVGRYLFPTLAIGRYEVHASKAGFQKDVRTGVHLAVGQEAVVDFALHVGEVTQQVVVDADAPAIGLTTLDPSGLVREQQIEDLPLNARSFDLLTVLNPGVVNFTWEKTGGTGVSNSTNANDFSVGGNRPQQNLYLLNGVEFTGGAENNMQPGGVSGVLLGVEAVQEFNILRDTYGAEYGKRPGGQVVIVTRSGTNDWHGSVYEFLRNNDLDAHNFFDVGSSAPPFRRNQFGLSGGGPTDKDKTFVFANYEGLRQTLDQTSVTLVPSNDSRSGTFVPFGSQCPVPQRAACAAAVRHLLNLWPVPNGPN